MNIALAQNPSQDIESVLPEPAQAFQGLQWEPCAVAPPDTVKRGEVWAPEAEGEEKPRRCCMQGGCCRLSPPREIIQNGRVERLNVMYRPSTWFCGRSPGMAGEDVYEVPYYLSKKGLSKAQWQEWTGKLREVNSHRSPICCSFLVFILLVLSVVGLCFLPFLCRMGRRRVEQWDTALRQWQADFNQVLAPLGIYCKTQSRCVVRYVYVSNGQGGTTQRQKHVERWVSFALSSASATSLRYEPHILGNADNLSCCGGFNEAELCCHP
jgi:hypothetical protein